VFTRYHVFVRATVGGEPALLLFDSGASATILSARLVARLGLAYRGRHIAFGIGEPVTAASVYEGTEIHIGSVRLRPATVLSWSTTGFPMYGPTAPDGVIGYDLLRAFVVTVDVQGGRIVAFDTSAILPAGRGRSIPLRVTAGLPVVSADVFASALANLPSTSVSSSLGLVVDFGAGAGLQLTRTASARLDFPARLRETRVRQLVGIGGAIELVEGITDSVRIAGASIPHVIVASDTSTIPSVALADADGFVGTEVLRRFAVTLDYARGRAIFEPNSALRVPFCRNAAGLCVRTGTTIRGAEVYWVDAGSPGARAGIRPGNIILAIDGTSVVNLSAIDVDRILERGGGPVLEIVRSAAQFRAMSRDPGTSRGAISRRAPARERIGELVRLPSP
jgi:hypothetical protein